MAVKKPIIYNKAEFCKAMAEKQGITQKDAAANLESFLATVTDILSNGNGIRFTGFGTLGVVKKAARTGINPSNGEQIKIPARKAVTFKAGTTLKESVNAKKTKAKK